MNGTMALKPDHMSAALVLVSGRMVVNQLSIFIPQGGVPKDRSLRWSKLGVAQGIPTQVGSPVDAANVPWIGAGS